LKSVPRPERRVAKLDPIGGIRYLRSLESGVWSVEQKFVARARPAPSPAPVCGRPEYHSLRRRQAAGASRCVVQTREVARCQPRSGARMNAQPIRVAATNWAERHSAGAWTSTSDAPKRSPAAGSFILRGTWAALPCGFPAHPSGFATCSRPTEVVRLIRSACRFPSPRTCLRQDLPSASAHSAEA
jgi:hypothetical protein